MEGWREGWMEEKPEGVMEATEDTDGGGRGWTEAGRGGLREDDQARRDGEMERGSDRGRKRSREGGSCRQRKRAGARE